MARNVEIKARVQNLEVIKRRVLDLKSTIDNSENNDTTATVVMEQEDIFYNLPLGKTGKLKLRKIQVGYINIILNMYT